MKTKWAILILILAGFIAYGNTLKNGLFWDDDEFIVRNAYIRSFRYLPQWFSQPLTAGAGVNSNYYRPLLQLSFAIDYKLWGLWPAGYHIENMLWHTTAGILLFVFLTEFLRNFRFKISDFRFSELVAFATALLWLVHPIHTEAVAYANSRGDSMATVFVLLTLILWMPPYGWSPVRVKKRFWASAIAFVLALLSKEFAIVTPGLMALISFVISFVNLTNGKFTVKETPRLTSGSLLIMFIITAIYIFLRLTTLNFQNTLNFYGADLTHIDAANPIARYATSPWIRSLTFLKVLPIYFKLLIWPTDLHMERTVEIPTTLSDQTALSSLIVITTIIVTSLFILYQGPALRSKAGPLLIIPFALGWFFISILPVSGLIPISQILAEHFLYFPSIGFFLLISWLLFSTVSYLPASPRFRLIVFYSLITPISMILLTKTIRQNRIWRDPITFYEYTLSKTTPTARVYNNLAMAYAETKEHQKAINNYQLAISLGDVYPNPHYNLGNTYIETGQVEKAEEEYKKALQIDPNFHYATLKLGQLYLDTNRTLEAKKLVCPVFPAQPLCL